MHKKGKKFAMQAPPGGGESVAARGRRLEQMRKNALEEYQKMLGLHDEDIGAMHHVICKHMDLLKERYQEAGIHAEQQIKSSSRTHASLNDIEENLKPFHDHMMAWKNACQNHDRAHLILKKHEHPEAKQASDESYVSVLQKEVQDLRAEHKKTQSEHKKTQALLEQALSQLNQTVGPNDDFMNQSLTWDDKEFDGEIGLSSSRVDDARSKEIVGGSIGTFGEGIVGEDIEGETTGDSYDQITGSAISSGFQANVQDAQVPKNDNQITAISSAIDQKAQDIQRAREQLERKRAADLSKMSAEDKEEVQKISESLENFIKDAELEHTELTKQFMAKQAEFIRQTYPQARRKYQEVEGACDQKFARCKNLHEKNLKALDDNKKQSILRIEQEYLKKEIDFEYQRVEREKILAEQYMKEREEIKQKLNETSVNSVDDLGAFKKALDENLEQEKDMRLQDEPKRAEFFEFLNKAKGFALKNLEDEFKAQIASEEKEYQVATDNIHSEVAAAFQELQATAKAYGLDANGKKIGLAQQAGEDVVAGVVGGVFGHQALADNILGEQALDVGVPPTGVNSDDAGE